MLVNQLLLITQLISVVVMLIELLEDGYNFRIL